MKKFSILIVLAVLTGIFFVSCGATPPGILGDWNITGGSYEQTDGYYTISGDYGGGSLSIEAGAFTMETEIDATYTYKGYTGSEDITVTYDGKGFVSVNSADKVISFFFSSSDQKDDWVNTNLTDDQDEYTQESISYYYELDGGKLTLTRDYSEGDVDWDYDYEISEEITLERK